MNKEHIEVLEAKATEALNNLELVDITEDPDIYQDAYNHYGNLCSMIRWAREAQYYALKIESAQREIEQVVVNANRFYGMLEEVYGRILEDIKAQHAKDTP